MRYGEVTNGLDRSRIVIPAIVIFNKSIASLELNSTQLCTLISALGTKNVTDDVTEWRRLAVKIFESTFMEVSDSILKAEDMPFTERSETEEMFDEERGDEIVDAYLGDDGSVMEVRRVKPKSKSKGGSKYNNSISSARANYNMPNRGSPSWNRNQNGSSATGNAMPNIMVNNAIGGGNKSDVRCFRCNQRGRGWRNCHFPRKTTLAFGDRGKVKIADQISATEANGVRPDQNALLSKSSTIGEKGIVGEKEGAAIKMAEVEWIQKYNLDAAQIMVFEAVSKSDVLYSQPNSHTDGGSLAKNVYAVIDSGATTTVVGESWLCSSGFDDEYPERQASQRRYRFGDSMTFGSMVG